MRHIVDFEGFVCYILILTLWEKKSKGRRWQMNVLAEFIAYMDYFLKKQLLYTDESKTEAAPSGPSASAPIQFA